MSLLATYQQDIRGEFPNALDRDEWRVTKYGLVNSTIDQTEGIDSIVSPDLKAKAMVSEGRVVAIPVMKKGSLTVTNTRTCTIGDYENDSALVNLTWTTLVVDISMVSAQYRKNEISYLADLQKKLRLVKDALLSQIESAIFTKLDTDKSTIFNSSLAGTKYPLVGDTLQVASADHEYFFNDIGAIQNSDDFYNNTFNVLGSTNLMPYVNHYIHQGPQNDENLSYQFGDKNFAFSNSVVDGASKLATGFILPDGAIGMLTRVNADAQMGHSTGDGTSWSTERIDGIPFDIGVMYKSKCSDQSALNGSGLEHLEATKVENWQFSVDFGLLTSYNSDPVTIASAIKKFEFVV